MFDWGLITRSEDVEGRVKLCDHEGLVPDFIFISRVEVDVDHETTQERQEENQERHQHLGMEKGLQIETCLTSEEFLGPR